MIRKPLSTAKTYLLRSMAILVLIVGYALLAHQVHIDNPTNTTIPTYAQIYEGAVSVVTPHHFTGEVRILVDGSESLVRFGASILLAVIIGSILGVLMGCFSWVEALFDWNLSMASNIIPTAMVTVFLAIFKTGLEFYIAVVAFGITPVFTKSVFLATKAVPNELIHNAYTLGASHGEVVWDVVVKTSLPRFIDAARLSIGPAMVYLMAAEYVLGSTGFGCTIRELGRQQVMAVVFTYIAVLALFGFSMIHSLQLLQRKLCPWYILEKG